MQIGNGRLASLFAKALGEGLEERFPIGAKMFQVLGPAAIEAIAGPNADPEDVARKLENVAKQEPEVVNNLGIEKWWQSGTTLGMGGSLLTALGALYAMIQQGNFDPAVMGPLVATVLASLFGLGRRWIPNLKPLFSRK